ncbi:MAG: NAD-dependent epimerase/dehydratase family protein [Planctomycetaceae bacterium]|nr:NAD-dependent epimerase/dehydratase family protein [Planctomycetaceae bacterium]
MRALVTGGGGFLGRYIVEQLLERGDDVRVLCRGDYPFLRELSVDYQRGDVRKREDVQRACEAIDTVFHTAAIPGIWGPWEKYHSINTQGTLNLLEASQHQGVSQFLYTSSPSVIFDNTNHVSQDESLSYPDHYLCHYPRSKALAEKAVLEANGQAGMATCSIRPHLMWGPRDNHLVPRLLQRAQSGRLVQVGDGSNMISVIYVENAAASHLQAADRLSLDSPVAGEAYFINEKEPVNLWSWIGDILAMAGLPPVRKSISYRTAYTVGTLMEWTYSALRLKSEPTMCRFLANQLSLSHTYKIEKAERDFGYQPLVSFEEGMQRMKADLPRMLETPPH